MRHYKPVASHVQATVEIESDGELRVDEEGDDDEGENATHAEDEEYVHFLIDIQATDDEEDLIIESADGLHRVLLDFVEELELPPPLSQHCHEGDNSIVCVAVLPENGHVTLLTWPSERVGTYRVCSFEYTLVACLIPK